MDTAGRIQGDPQVYVRGDSAGDDVATVVPDEYVRAVRTFSEALKLHVQEPGHLLSLAYKESHSSDSLRPLLVAVAEQWVDAGLLLEDCIQALRKRRNAALERQPDTAFAGEVARLVQRLGARELDDLVGPMGAEAGWRALKRRTAVQKVVHDHDTAETQAMAARVASLTVHHRRTNPNSTPTKQGKKPPAEYTLHKRTAPAP